jgi:hypothetical protein
MAKHRAICPSLVTVASLLTLLLGAAIMAEAAIADVPRALLWQLGIAWVTCSVALGLREGRRWALSAMVLVAVVSPGLAIVAAQRVGPAGVVPFLLAPVALALLIPERSARWLRRRRPATLPRMAGTPDVGTPPVPALRAVQGDYVLAGALAPGQLR